MAWPDPLGTDIKVTFGVGPWSQGGRQCLEEYGDQGYVFTVPVNGLMNQAVKHFKDDQNPVWLNYNSIRTGDWAINARPRAIAGVTASNGQVIVDDPVVAECTSPAGAEIELNGSISSPTWDDRIRDNDQLDFEWELEDASLADGERVWQTFALSDDLHKLVLWVDDGYAGADSASLTVQVVDTTPPEIDFTLLSDIQWPPNHQMALVAESISVLDVCDVVPTLTVSVESNEPVNGVGDGNAEPDWDVVPNGDGTFDVWIRAERSGPGTGRIYTITSQSMDASGNSSVATETVTVPHDQ